jgi:hypothetical protein
LILNTADPWSSKELRVLVVVDGPTPELEDAWLPYTYGTSAVGRWGIGWQAGGADEEDDGSCC